MAVATRIFNEHAPADGHRKGRQLYRIHGIQRDTATPDLQQVFGSDWIMPDAALARLPENSPNSRVRPLWFDSEGEWLPEPPANNADLTEAVTGLFADMDDVTRLFPRDPALITVPPRFDSAHEYLLWYNEAQQRARTTGVDLFEHIRTNHAATFIDAIEEVKDVIYGNEGNSTVGRSEGVLQEQGAELLRALLGLPAATEQGSTRSTEAGVSVGSEDRPDTRVQRGTTTAGDVGTGEVHTRHNDVTSVEVETIDDADVEIATDFHTTEALGRIRGAKNRARANLEAIHLLNELGDEPATRAQQEVLAEYVGWGGIPQLFDEDKAEWEDLRTEFKDLVSAEAYTQALESTLNAHYTTVPLIRGIYESLGAAGYDGKGNVFEGGCGVGHFFGASPHGENETRVGVEMDEISARIAQKLYPNATVHHQALQDFYANNDSFDLALGNPPFAQSRVSDKHHADLKNHTLHNYFIAKQMRLVKPGGIGVFIVSHYFLDAGDVKTRKLLNQTCDLLGAVRLPNTAFAENANTQVVTDVVAFRRRLPNEVPSQELPDWVQTDRVDTPSGERVSLNRYIHNNKATAMIGDVAWDHGMYSDNEYTVQVEEPLSQEDLASELERKLTYQVKGDHYQPLDQAQDLDMGDDIPDEVRRLMRPHHLQLGAVVIDSNDQAWAVKPKLRLSRDDDVTLINNRFWKREKLPLRPSDIKRLKPLLAIRDTIRALVDSESRVEENADCEVLRAQLNRQVDAFRKAFTGKWASNTNKRLLREDADGPLVLSLIDDEIKGEGADKERARKAAILHGRVTYPPRERKHTKNLQEAYLIATSTPLVEETLEERVADITGEQEAYVRNMLIRQQLAFVDLEDQRLVPAEEYLSGDLGEKIEAIETSGKAAQFKYNLEALQDRLPEQVPAEDIYMKIGSSWIPPEVYSDFTKDVLCEPMHVTISDGLRRFSMQTYWQAGMNEPVSNFRNRATAQSVTYGTRHRGRKATDIFAKLLNAEDIDMYDSVPTPRPGGGMRNKKVKNLEKTQEVTLAAERMEDAFKAWVLSDQERAQQLATIYNRKFNSRVNRKWDGTHLQLDNIERQGIQLRPNQRSAIMRCIAQEACLVNHVVGAGKTFIGAVAEMEKKKSGLSTKSMLVVPNHLIAQWSKEILRLYPAANVLALNKDRINKKNRNDYMAKIATGAWDFIICPESTFGTIPLAKSTQERYIEAELDLLGREEGSGTKSYSRARQSLRNKLTDLRDKTEDPETITWEHLGVDSLVVDEAHNFKNLSFRTSMGKQGIAGLPNEKGSKKATDLQWKIRHMREQDTRSSVTFLTGTPISNSLAECFHMLTYLDPEGLRKVDSHTFDNFVKNFAKIQNDWEVGLTGTNFIQRRRLSTFHNVPELQKIWGAVCDTCTLDDLQKDYQERFNKWYPVPRIKTGTRANNIADPDELTAMATEEIVQRMANPPEDPSVDNALKCLTDASRRSLDMRLEFPKAKPNPASKVRRAAKEIIRIADEWAADRGTQLVFCDTSTPKQFRQEEMKTFETVCRRANEGNEEAIQKKRMMEMSMHDEQQFDVYNELKQTLIAESDGRLKSEEIAFIHEANTDQRKQKLFNQVNAGEVRVLIGSTWKMGTGMNVQERLVGLHHMDAPWRPSDIQQREGRIERPGNHLYERDPDNFAVEIQAYTTARTADSKRYQTLETKQRMIDSFSKERVDTREVEDISGVDTMSYADFKAATAAEPRIQQELELRAEKESLQKKSEDFERRQREMERALPTLEQAEALHRSTIAQYETTIDYLEQHVNDGFCLLDERGLRKGNPLIVPHTQDAGENEKTFKARQSAVSKEIQKVMTQRVQELFDVEGHQMGLGIMHPLFEYQGCRFMGTCAASSKSNVSRIVRLYPQPLTDLNIPSVQFDDFPYLDMESFSAAGLSTRMQNRREKTFVNAIEAEKVSITRDNNKLASYRDALEEGNGFTEALAAKRSEWEALRMDLGMDLQQDGGKRKDYQSDYPRIHLDADTGVAYDRDFVRIRPLEQVADYGDVEDEVELKSVIM